ncbi:MAG: MFS transporter [Candidatus Bathyarchaeota archaeon]|nr:MFS transporter [Candidatus Bathyarchaeota archaeon]
MNFRLSVKTVLSNRNLMAVTVTQSLSMFAMFLWRPFWGLYVLELDGTKSILGALTTLQLLSTLLLQLPGGVLSDRIGRKRVIMAASLFGFLPPLIFRVSTHWMMLIPGILAMALSSLATPALMALIADSLPEENRATGFGAYTMIWYLSIVVSYPIGGYIMDSIGLVPGTHIGLIISLLLTIPVVLIRWRFIEETVELGVESPVNESKYLPSIAQIRNIPSEIWKLVVVAVLSSFSFQVFWSFVVVYCVEVVGLSMMQWSYVSIISNLAGALFMIPSGFLSDRYGRKRIIILSQLAVSSGSLGYTLSGGFKGVALTRLVGGVGEGLGGNVMGSAAGPVWQALVTEVAPVESRGSIIGLMGTLTGFLTTPAPIVGGYLYEHLSPQLPFQVSFVLGVLGSLIFAIWIREPERAFNDVQIDETGDI